MKNEIVKTVLTVKFKNLKIENENLSYDIGIAIDKSIPSCLIGNMIDSIVEGLEDFLNERKIEKDHYQEEFARFSTLARYVEN